MSVNNESETIPAGVKHESTSSVENVEQTVNQEQKQELSSDDQEQPKSGGSWWSSGLSTGLSNVNLSSNLTGWYESAKQKSSQAIEFMKKDLAELKDTVQQESAPILSTSTSYINSTASAVSSTANYIKDTVNSLVEEDEGDQTQPEDSSTTNRPHDWPESLSMKVASVFTSLVDALSPQLGEDDDDLVILPGRNVTVPRDRWELLLKAVQSDPETYTSEPDTDSDAYKAWSNRFSLSDHEHQIEDLVNTVADITSFYNELVPAKISHETFWTHYFYRIEQLTELEAHRAAKDVSPELVITGKDEIVGSQSSVHQSPSNSNLATEDDSESKESDASVATGASSVKSRGTSEDWEKADLDDIVGEAAKKLAEKLEAGPPPRRESQTKSDEEEWEFE